MLTPVIDHLWQSTLIAVAAGAAALLLRRRAARWRYWIWFAASLKFLVPFALIAGLGAQLAWRVVPADAGPGEWQMLARQVFEPTASLGARAPETGRAPETDRAPEIVPVAGTERAPVPLPAENAGLASDLLAQLGSYDAQPASRESAAAGAAAAAEAGGGNAAAWRGWLPSVPLVVVGVWMLGSALILLRWMRRWLELRKRVRDAKPLRVAVSGAGAIEVRSCTSIMEPGVFGIFRPVLLVPEGIVERLSHRQLEAIVQHERAHIEHRDNLTASLHMVVEALFWFHPFVWWIGARMVEERERACDEAVLAAGVDPDHYASGLVEVCDFYVESPLLCAAGVGGGSLEDRVQRIADNEQLPPPSRLARAALAAASVGALLVPFSVGLLSTTAVRAQAGASDGSAANLLQCVDPHVVASLLRPAIGQGTVYTDELPEQMSGITTPVRFDWIGGAKRSLPLGMNAAEIDAVFRTELPAAEARSAALAALDEDGWELQERAQSGPFGRGAAAVFPSGLPSQPDVACLDDRTVTLDIGEVDDVTYVTYAFPDDEADGACRRSAQDRFAPRGMLDDYMPRLEFPPDPETGVPPRRSGGGMSSRTGSQQTMTEITHSLPIDDLVSYLEDQLAEQGWAVDATWSGSSTGGSAWSKQFESGERALGTLDVTRTADARYSIMFRVVALK